MERTNKQIVDALLLARDEFIRVSGTGSELAISAVLPKYNAALLAVLVRMKPFEDGADNGTN